MARGVSGLSAVFLAEGGGGVTIPPDPFINRFQNVIHSEFHIQIVEPQKTNPKTFQSLLSCCILRIPTHVACAVYFNCKEQLWTKRNPPQTYQLVFAGGSRALSSVFV